ncbi:hypothetical protein OJ252_3149, partial [Cryptosporidium canis]
GPRAVPELELVPVEGNGVVLLGLDQPLEVLGDHRVLLLRKVPVVYSDQIPARVAQRLEEWRLELPDRASAVGDDVLVQDPGVVLLPLLDHKEQTHRVGVKLASTPVDYALLDEVVGVPQGLVDVPEQQQTRPPRVWRTRKPAPTPRRAHEGPGKACCRKRSSGPWPYRPSPRSRGGSFCGASSGSEHARGLSPSPRKGRCPCPRSLARTAPRWGFANGSSANFVGDGVQADHTVGGVVGDVAAHAGVEAAVLEVGHPPGPSVLQYLLVELNDVELLEPVAYFRKVIHHKVGNQQGQDAQPEGSRLGHLQRA